MYVEKENGDGWSESVDWLVLRGRNGGVGFGVSGNFFVKDFVLSGEIGRLMR